MSDDKSTIGKYVTVLLAWLIPVLLVLIPLVYPDEGYARDMLALPVIFLLLYVAFLVAPLLHPLKNLDFFDDIPEVVERYSDAQRARRDARDLMRLYDGGRLPNVYELRTLTPFQRDVKRMADRLRADVDWHSGNAEVSRDLLERMETLMRATEEEEAVVETVHQQRKSGKKS